MNIEIVDCQNQDVDIKELFKDCQPLVDENLVVNGGTLKMANLIDGDYNWSHLVLMKHEGNIIGFALIRISDYDQHSTGYDKYYYISQIVIKKELQHNGLGTILLEKILEEIKDHPIVSSVLRTNEASMTLFSKNMSSYSEKGNYIRFMDNYYYDLNKQKV